MHFHVKRLHANTAVSPVTVEVVSVSSRQPSYEPKSFRCQRWGSSQEVTAHPVATLRKRLASTFTHGVSVTRIHPAEVTHTAAETCS